MMQYAWAGGSFLEVTVKEFTRLETHNYRLTVVPTDEQPRRQTDSYMGKCAEFTVVGTFRRSRKVPEFTKETQAAVLAGIEVAYLTHTTINFGWMGSGLAVLNKNNPCVVRSQALGKGWGRVNADKEVSVIFSYY